MPRKLSHYDGTGKARMVDVSDKSAGRREAHASAWVAMKPAVLDVLPKNRKGDPLPAAWLAGIMGAKQTSNLIPMCPPSSPGARPSSTMAAVREWRRCCQKSHPHGSNPRGNGSAGGGQRRGPHLCTTCARLSTRASEIREIALKRKSGGKSGDHVRPPKKP